MVFNLSTAEVKFRQIFAFAAPEAQFAATGQSHFSGICSSSVLHMMGNCNFFMAYLHEYERQFGPYFRARMKTQTNWPLFSCAELSRLLHHLFRPVNQFLERVLQ